jgi:hypothetical protein
MRYFVISLALFNFAPINPSQAACPKPDTPACAIQTVPFAKDQDADNCRKEMLLFRIAMDVYALCLGVTSPDDEKAARDGYEDVRMRFNRRAAGRMKEAAN